MRTLAVLEELPPGYFVEESPRGVLALHADVARRFHEAGFGPQSDGSLTQSDDLFGRRPMFELELGGERFVLRRFHHGGLLRWLTGDRFTDPERPFRELVLSHAVRRKQLPTPQVVAARARMATGGGWLLDVVTRRVEGAIDFGRVLIRMGRGEVPERVRPGILGAAGRLVRDMHRRGFLHADLTPNNLLVSEEALRGGEPLTWVIDLDGSTIVEEADDDARRRNLRRLYRHVLRFHQEGALGLRRTDFARFFAGYDPAQELWKEDWRGVLRMHGASRGLHAGGWLLERGFGARARPVELKSEQVGADETG